MNLNIERAFNYPRLDPNWLNKLLIGSVLFFIPFVNFIAFGYFIRCIRDVAEGRDETLPEWTDFGPLFIKGAMMTLVYILYLLPYMAFLGVSIGIMIVGGVAAESGGSHPSGGSLALLMMTPFVIWIVSIVYVLAISFIMPAVIYLYAIHDDFKAAFNFTNIMAFIKGNLTPYIIMLLLDYLAFTIAGFGIIACGIGILFTTVYSYLFACHLLGQMVAYTRENAAGDAAAC